MKSTLGLNLKTVSIVGTSLAICIAIASCVESPRQKAPISNGNTPVAPVAPVAPAAPVAPLATASKCETLSQIIKTIHSPATADLTASDPSRFCIHEIVVATMDINNVSLPEGLKIEEGLKLAIADVEYGDHGVTFSQAKSICESLTIEGGGWSLPTSSTAEETRSISLETITTYLHNSNFPIGVRFFGLSALTGDQVAVGIPSTGITTQVMDMTGEALICIKK